MIEATKEDESGTAKEFCMKPIIDYLGNSKLLEDKNDTRKLRLKAATYALIDGILFRKSFSGPLLRCVSEEKSRMILQVKHSRVCGNYFRGRSLAHKAITVGYFWPYMIQEVQDYAKKFKKSQKHRL